MDNRWEVSAPHIKSNTVVYHVLSAEQAAHIAADRWLSLSCGDLQDVRQIGTVTVRNLRTGETVRLQPQIVPRDGFRRLWGHESAV